MLRGLSRSCWLRHAGGFKDGVPSRLDCVQVHVEEAGGPAGLPPEHGGQVKDSSTELVSYRVKSTMGDVASALGSTIFSRHAVSASLASAW